MGAQHVKLDYIRPESRRASKYSRPTLNTKKGQTPVLPTKKNNKKNIPIQLRGSSQLQAFSTYCKKISSLAPLAPRREEVTILNSGQTEIGNACFVRG